MVDQRRTKLPDYRSSPSPPLTTMTENTVKSAENTTVKSDGWYHTIAGALSARDQHYALHYNEIFRSSKILFLSIMSIFVFVSILFLVTLTVNAVRSSCENRQATIKKQHESVDGLQKQLQSAQEAITSYESGE